MSLTPVFHGLVEEEPGDVLGPQLLLVGGWGLQHVALSRRAPPPPDLKLVPRTLVVLRQSDVRHLKSKIVAEN